MAQPQINRSRDVQAEERREKETDGSELRTGGHRPQETRRAQQKCYGMTLGGYKRKSGHHALRASGVQDKGSLVLHERREEIKERGMARQWKVVEYFRKCHLVYKQADCFSLEMCEREAKHTSCISKMLRLFSQILDCFLNRCLVDSCIAPLALFRQPKRQMLRKGCVLQVSGKCCQA